MDSVLAKKASDYVRVTSVLMKRALDELEPLKNDYHSATSLSGDVSSKMVSSGLIEESEKQAAEKYLATHTGTLQVLGEAIDSIKELVTTQKEAGDIGYSVGRDSQGDGDVSPENAIRFLGGGQGNEKRARDKAYERRLLGYEL